jgi:hypothetical protein
LDPEKANRPAYSHRPVTAEALLIPIPAALRMIPCSRAKLYQYIKDGTIRSRTVGSRRFLVRESLEAFARDDDADADRGAA